MINFILNVLYVILNVFRVVKNMCVITTCKINFLFIVYTLSCIDI